MHNCSAKTSKGNQCSRAAKVGNLCTYHHNHGCKFGLFIDEVVDESSNEDRGSCPICLDKAEDDDIGIGSACGHFIHQDCAQGLYKLECPVCRASLDDAELLESKDQIRARENAEKERRIAEQIEEDALMASPEVDVERDSPEWCFEIEKCVLYAEHLMADSDNQDENGFVDPVWFASKMKDEIHGGLCNTSRIPCSKYDDLIEEAMSVLIMRIY